MDVAWLALAVAVLSLLWQIVDARQRRRTKVTVEVRHMAVPAYLDGPDLLAVPAVGLDDRPMVWSLDKDETLAYVLAVVIVNRGETTESVADVRIVNIAGTAGVGADDGTGHRELPPRERVTWAFRPDRLSFDASEGFFVEAVLASGEIARSGPHELEKALLDRIAERELRDD